MKQTYDMVTIGSALRDTMFISDDTHVIDNPRRNSECTTLMCVEYGSKVQSPDVSHSVGGGAANAGVNFVQLGLKTAIVAALGRDGDGELVKRHLMAHGLQTRSLQYSERYQTGFSFILIDRKTNDHSAFVHYGASQSLALTDPHQIPSSRWYYISSLNARTWKATLRTIFSKPGQFVWNPGNKQIQAGLPALKRFFKSVNVLIVNKDEAISLVRSVEPVKSKPSVKQLATILHRYCPQLIVITDGPNGSYVFDGTTLFASPAPSIKPVDTTGAGDRFGSSFVAGLVRYDGNIDRSLQLAAYTTHRLIQEVGAQSGLVQWKDLPGRLR